MAVRQHINLAFEQFSHCFPTLINGVSLGQTRSDSESQTDPIYTGNPDLTSVKLNRCSRLTEAPDFSRDLRLASVELDGFPDIRR
jgi:hypothetical protein